MKKSFLFAVTALLSVLLTSEVQAHEGHDHNGPAGVQAPKGGTIRGREEDFIEVVSKGKDIKVYFYDKDLKPLDPALFTTTAKVQLPRVKKTEDLALTIKDNALEGTYEAKKTHRYTLLLSVKNQKDDSPDTLKYTIEPKK